MLGFYIFKPLRVLQIDTKINVYIYKGLNRCIHLFFGMAKLGEQIKQQEAAERRVGKLGQQVGAKPTRAAELRAKQEVEKKKEELEKTQQKLSGKSLADYGEAYEEIPSWQKQYFESPEKIKQEIIKEEIPKYEKEIEKLQKAHAALKTKMSDPSQYNPVVHNPQSYALAKRISTLEEYRNQTQRGDIVTFAQANTAASQAATQLERSSRKQEQYQEVKSKVEAGEITSMKEIPLSYQSYFSQVKAPQDSSPAIGTYTSPEGYKMSMARETALKKIEVEGGEFDYGANIVSPEKYDLSAKDKLYSALGFQTEPYLQEEVMYIEQGIPETGVFRYDPQKGFGREGYKTKATPEETEWFRSRPSQNELVASSKEVSIPYLKAKEKIMGAYSSILPEEMRQTVEHYGPITGTHQIVTEKATEWLKPTGGVYYTPIEMKGTSYYRGGEFVPAVSKVELEQRKKESTAIAKKSFYKTAYTAPYFASWHVAAGLLIGEGIESYAFPGGRESIRETGKKLGELGILGEGKAEMIAWGIPAGQIALGGYILKTGLTKPQIKLGKKPEPKTIYVERVKPQKDWLTSKAQFKIIQYEPARYAEVTSTWKKLLGKKPQQFIIQKPTIRTVTTLEPIKLTAKGEIIGEPALGFSRVGKEGTGVNRFIARIRGGEQPTSLARFEDLPKTQRYAFQKMAEAKTGLPVSQKYAPQILGKRYEEAIYGRGTLELEKVWRVKDIKKGWEFTYVESGRRIERAAIVSKGEEAKNIFLPSQYGRIKIPVPEGVDIIKGEIAIKPTTMPFARASGKVPILRGYTYIEKPTEAATTIFTAPTTTPTTNLQQISLSKFSQTLGEVKATAVKAFPTTQAKVPVSLTGRTIASQEILGTTASTAKVLDTFQYQEKAKTITKTETKTITAPVTKPLTKTISKPITKPVTKIISKSITKPVSKSITKPLSKTITKPVTKFVTKPITKPVTKPSTKPSSRPLPKKTPPRRIPPPIPFPSFEPYKKTITRKKKKRIPIDIFRKPSLVGLGMEIKVPKIKGIETAFSIRPIITKSKRRKKKNGFI